MTTWTLPPEIRRRVEGVSRAKRRLDKRGELVPLLTRLAIARASCGEADPQAAADYAVECVAAILLATCEPWLEIEVPKQTRLDAQDEAGRDG